ncbi:histidine triad nucleotide-binding protein [Patescibacteria group bacterium]
MKDCVFCKIASGELPTELIYQSKNIVAFNDINPLAPVHVIIIPRLHIKTVDDLGKKDEHLAGEMILTAQKIARELKINEKGYKLLLRVKEHGGQEIDHLHLHLIGGAKLTENIQPIKSEARSTK